LARFPSLDPITQLNHVKGPAFAGFRRPGNFAARRQGLQRALALAGDGDRGGHFDALGDDEQGVGGAVRRRSTRDFDF
jgi:hypothetical protein